MAEVQQVHDSATASLLGPCCAHAVQVGSPLTHQRYLNRHKGTYGPAISAATSSFPGCKTPLAGLYRCALPYCGPVCSMPQCVPIVARSRPHLASQVDGTAAADRSLRGHTKPCARC